jgi:hypothetical protein
MVSVTLGIHRNAVGGRVGRGQNDPLAIHRRGIPTDAVFYFQKRRFNGLVTTDLASSGIHLRDVAACD